MIRSDGPIRWSDPGFVDAGVDRAILEMASSRAQRECQSSTKELKRNIRKQYRRRNGLAYFTNAFDWYAEVLIGQTFDCCRALEAIMCKSPTAGPKLRS